MKRNIYSYTIINSFIVLIISFILEISRFTNINFISTNRSELMFFGIPIYLIIMKNIFLYHNSGERFLYSLASFFIIFISNILILIINNHYLYTIDLLDNSLSFFIFTIIQFIYMLLLFLIERIGVSMIKLSDTDRFV